tara:strand:+ start:13156 stop:14634 length:1479 start_codon:yes stop_codon:yes gene_type:complete
MPYQFNAMKTVTGMVTENHLGIMFQNKPQFLKKSVTRLLSSEGVRNLDTLLNQFPVSKMAEEGIFYWDITGDNEMNVGLVEARFRGAVVTAADNNVGANGEAIELVFPEEAPFSKMHMIVGEKNEIYQVRLTSDAYYEGTNLVFRGELMGNNQNGMPGSELIADKRWSKDFSPVEDYVSTEGGEVTFASPARVGNEMTTLRIQHKEPGKNIGKKVATSILLKRGDQEIETMAWMPAVEWTIEKTWSYEKAHACAFARSNRSADGRYFNVGQSGFFIKQGMGLREQQESANRIFYDKFSLAQLENLLFDIGEGRLEFSDRTILMRTGERGASQFHKAVMDVATGWTALTTANPQTYAKTSSPMHSNAFVAGFQFTEFLSPMGYHIKVETDPMYDSKVRNKLKAPHLGGGVAESYRYDIYFIGSTDSPNIYKVELERGDDWGYKSGFRNPFTGERNIQNMGHMEDSAIYTRYGSFGTAIVDPGRTVAYLPSILQ